MQLLKRKDLYEQNVVSFTQPKKCLHCLKTIKSRKHAYGYKFYTKSSKIYIHYDCNEEFLKSLR